MLISSNYAPRNGSGGLAHTRDRRLAVLAFHKIGAPRRPDGWETWFFVPEAVFAGHLKYLQDHGWQVIDIRAFLAGLLAPETLPDKAALLTFDDGYRSMCEVALPWLRRFGFPGILFVPTDFIGGNNRFDAGDEPDEPICDWDDLATLECAGVSIQSHSVSHRAFSELDPATQERELLESKRVLERGLAKPIEVFSYPYGDAGPDPGGLRVALERAGYRAACLYGGGPHRLPISDPYSIERVAIGPDTDLDEELRRT